MSDRARLVVVLVGVWLFVLGVLALTVLIIGADLSDDERAAVATVAGDRAVAAAIIATLLLIPAAFVIRAVYRQYSVAARQLSEDARVMLKANPSHRAIERGAAELRRLARDFNDFAAAREALQHNVEARVAEANARIEQERNRLAALMSELAQSVLVCNTEGRILLYNARAMRLLHAPDDARTHTLVGLGRSVYAIFDRSIIAHALDTLREAPRSDPSPVHSFVTTSPAGQLVRLQIAPVRSASSEAVGQPSTISGFVLLLDDITRTIETDQRRDLLLQTLTQGTRASLGSIRAAVETIASFPSMDEDSRARLLAVIGDEARELTAKLDDTTSAFASVLRSEWPLESMRGADVIAAARRRIETQIGLATKLESIDDDIWLKVDSYSLVQGITYLARRLSEEFRIRELRFNLEAHAALAYLDLVWTGAPLGSETAMAWQTDPLQEGGESSVLTLRDIVERHNAEIWYQIHKPSQWEFFRIALPRMHAAPPRAEPLRGIESRPEFYDFDLFAHQAGTPELDAQALTSLQYTVFDTETTGLDPRAGDEIVSIAAVRIVNGRVLRHERFEQLVNPQRAMSAEARAITGIEDADLADKQPIGQVLPAFARFCADTVLVAHNAAFDMRFLQLKEASTGVCFRQPVLDTLLLSAVLHPNLASNQLESIAQRMGVDPVGRHTALGDAIITADVFLRMIPLLADRGIRTLGDARAASEKTFLARLAY